MKYLAKMLQWIPTQLILSQGNIPPPPLDVIMTEDNNPILTEDGHPLLIE